MNMNALLDFINHFGIKPKAPPRRLLEDVVTAFSHLPYENITKIIKHAESGSAQKARHYPEEVIRNHIAWGTGGTCFSLTATLCYLVRSLGWPAEYILADRRYGTDTHCALLVWIEGKVHLLDPGFLIFHAVELSPEREQQIDTGCNHLILAPDQDVNRISLFTVRRGKRNYRLTYKTSPVDEGEFLKAWDASFDWEMMQYPLLTRIAGDKQIYLRGSRLQISRTDAVEKRQIALDKLVEQITAYFRMEPRLIARALSILKERGEVNGKAW